MNRVEISGNLARDIEINTTASGLSIGNFCVAVNDRVKQQDGTWGDYVNWIDCTLFGARCDGLAPYLHKGQKVLVAGKLHWSSWEAQDGSKRSRVNITVEDIELIGNRQNQSSEQPATEVVENDDEFPF